MSNGDKDKLYRIKTKDGARVNEKEKEDGSKSAIQFDEKNRLQGPVDLVEVDPDEYTQTVYVEVERKERTITEVIVSDVFAPVANEIIMELAERALNKGIDIFFAKVVPALKKKGGDLIGRARGAQARKGPKAESIRKSPAKQQPVYHSQEEVNQIVNNMRFATLYIAAGIRELSNTVVTGLDDAGKADMEAKLKELSSEEVLSTINFMLEAHNRDALDDVTLQLFEAFRNRNLIINGETVPISRYISSEDGEKYEQA